MKFFIFPDGSQKAPERFFPFTPADDINVDILFNLLRIECIMMPPNMEMYKSPDSFNRRLNVWREDCSKVMAL